MSLQGLLRDEYLDRLGELIRVRNRWTHVGIVNTRPIVFLEGPRANHRVDPHPPVA